MCMDVGLNGVGGFLDSGTYLSGVFHDCCVTIRPEKTEESFPARRHSCHVGLITTWAVFVTSQTQIPVKPCSITHLVLKAEQCQN